MQPTLDGLLARVDGLVVAHPGQRVVIGIVGEPGSGKTTLAEAVVLALLDSGLPWASGRTSDGDARRPWIGSHVAHLPMDGFHLADAELERLGRSARKGAPDTFDAAGYAALLVRVRDAGQDVWAPAFDRDLEQPIAGSVPILRAARVVVTEGNYLLLDAPEWNAARRLVDETWYCDLDPAVRLERLIARHVRFGKSPSQAHAWATGTDQRNADLIAATSSRADLIVTEDAARPPAGQSTARSRSSSASP